MGNHPARILFISNDFAPAVGGIARLMGAAARALPPEQVLVVAQAESGDAVFDAGRRFPVRRIPYAARRPFARLVSLARYGAAILRAVRGGGVGGVVFDKPLPLGLFGPLLRAAGVPYAVGVYGNDLLRPLGAITRALQRRVLRGARVVFGCSAFTAAEAVRWGVPADRAVAVCPGIDPEAFGPPGDPGAFRRAQGLDARRVVLSVGRLVERKGFDRVIASLPTVAASVPEVVYVLVGDGPDGSRLAGLAQAAGVADRVRFIKGCTDAEAAAWYHACDVFAMVSRYIPERGDVEGFGIVYLEANACGKPVVAGRSGGVADAVADGVSGCLVEPDDVDGLADTLVRLLKDPGWAAQLGRQGRARVLAGFTLERYGREFRERVVAPLLDREAT